MGIKHSRSKTNAHSHVLSVHVLLIHVGSSSCVVCVNLHRIVESFRLEKTFKIIESNHKLNTAKFTTEPCP